MRSNLPGVEERLHEEARRLKIERNLSARLLNSPTPCRVSTQSIEWGVRGAQVSREHPRKAYDFGVLSIILEIPLQNFHPVRI